MTVTRPSRIVVGVLAASVAMLSAAMADIVRAAERHPLLMDGKKTLYQRVLTRPGATMGAEPGKAGKEKVPALSQFYVYERREVGGSEWLEVGASSSGKSDGWLRAQETIPWKTQMSLAFTNPAGRQRTLLFRDRETVAEILDSPQPAEVVRPIRESIIAGAKDERVVSIEPEVHIDIGEQFYLLPILESDVRRVAGRDVRVLEVASVTKKEGDPSPAPAPAPATQRASRAAALRNFSAAVVFVIDSTISMEPYIERTRAAVRQIYDQIEKAGLVDRVKFGLVAYRSSTKKVPGLEYEAKIFVNPNEVEDGKDFLKQVEKLRAAEVSSAKFEEDAFAGLMMAIGSSRGAGVPVSSGQRMIDWSKFGGRYLVLVTDAGPISSEDPLSTTRLGAAEVKEEIDILGMAVAVLHLKTPAGKRNHAKAEDSYREVSFNDVANKPLYYPIQAGSVDEFGDKVERLGRSIVEQVQGASRGEIVPGSARSATGAASQAEGSAHEAAPQKADTSLEADAQLLGRAMQLAYLGRVQEATAPEVFRASLADRDLDDLDVPTAEVRVLLTKNQLSDLAQRVKAILEAGDESQDTSTADFYDLMRTAVAQLARDPAALKGSKASMLGADELGEYLEGLPYRSQWMGLEKSEWVSKGISEQEELLDRLRRSLRHYRIYNEDQERWVKLAPGADVADRVYPVPLSALP